jgi:hypothetical protein
MRLSSTIRSESYEATPLRRRLTVTIPSEVAKSDPRRCAAAAAKAQSYRARGTSDYELRREGRERGETAQER